MEQDDPGDAAARAHLGRITNQPRCAAFEDLNSAGVHVRVGLQGDPRKKTPVTALDCWTKGWLPRHGMMWRLQWASIYARHAFVPCNSRVVLLCEASHAAIDE
eukprot:36655-Pelagomonas_calceolata.AAC.1